MLSPSPANSEFGELRKGIPTCPCWGSTFATNSEDVSINSKTRHFLRGVVLTQLSLAARRHQPRSSFRLRSHTWLLWCLEILLADPINGTNKQPAEIKKKRYSNQPSNYADFAFLQYTSISTINEVALHPPETARPNLRSLHFLLQAHNPRRTFLQVSFPSFPSFPAARPLSTSNITSQDPPAWSTWRGFAKAISSRWHTSRFPSTADQWSAVHSSKGASIWCFFGGISTWMAIQNVIHQ